MSILSVIQDAAASVSLTRPSVIIGSQDKTVQQLFWFAVEECQALNKLWWQSMTREKTFLTVAAAEQTNALPDDLDRFWPDSFFNRSTNRKVVGPVTVQQWQLIQSNSAAAYVTLAYRQRDGAFLATPTPPAGQTIAYEYISTKWARSEDLLTAKLRWTVDTDTSYFDESLITLGIIWRWRARKGLSHDEDYDKWETRRDQLMANDGGSTKLSFAPPCDSYTPPLPTVPEGFSW